jgi:hypothetical protein
MMPPSDEPEAKWQRPVEPAIEELIGRRYDVLDDGFVRVVDYLGNDAAIVQAARVSYGACFLWRRDKTPPRRPRPPSISYAASTHDAV